MTIDLDALEAAAQAATPGPWQTDATPSAIHALAVTELIGDDVIGDVFAANDATLIALADPTTIRALVAVARAARYQHETGDLHDPDHEPPFEFCCGVGAALKDAGL